MCQQQTANLLSGLSALEIMFRLFIFPSSCLCGMSRPTVFAPNRLPQTQTQVKGIYMIYYKHQGSGITSHFQIQIKSPNQIQIGGNPVSSPQFPTMPTAPFPTISNPHCLIIKSRFVSLIILLIYFVNQYWFLCVQGLGWMRSCEKRPLHSRFPSGGILADEMGLGKTGMSCFLCCLIFSMTI
jgi:hypothetical protein